MRILHVVPTYLPAVRYGGPIFAVHGLAKAQAAAGHRVRVFTTNVDGPTNSAVPVDEPVVRDGVSIRYFPAAFRRLYYAPQMGYRLSREVADNDVVHLHSVFLYPTAAGARLAGRHAVPYVLSPRGMLVPDLIKAQSAFLKRAWITAFERRNLARAAAIHLTSTLEEAALVELGLDLAPTVVIPNGVDHGQLAARSAPKWPTELRHESFDVLALGRINWKKGLDLLIRSLAQLPGVTATIAGNDEDGYAPTLKSLAAQCGVADRISFLVRRVDEAEKAALFAAGRVVVVPSISENFGNVVTEALAHRKPVVATAGVGAGDIVAAAGAGVVCAFDTASLAEAIADLVKRDDRELDRLGRAGEAYVRDHLPWSRIAARFTELYRTLQTDASPMASLATTA